MRRFDWLKTFSLINKTLPSSSKPPLHSHFLRNFSASKFPPPPPPISEKSSTLLKNVRASEPDRPLHLINKAERIKAQEDQARLLNIGVLRRELLNDCVQLPLKYFAWKSAPLHVAPTFLAELTRASIDALNHVILFAINRLSIAPSAKYPYGMDKIKNATALIPAALFLYFGAETMYSSFIELMYEPTILAHENDSSMWPILAYMTSISVELSIVAKNILDATYDKSNKNQPIKDRLKNLFKKKDPLLQVVLYENAITLTSSSIPLLFSGIHAFHPIPWLDSVGSFAIGAIEMYVGYHLADENVPTLIGEGVDQETYNQIIKTIKENPYVTEVKNVKTILIGPSKFKVVAEITYELDKLTERVLETYKHIIDQVVYEQEYEDRQEYIEHALGLLPKRFMKEIQIQNNSIEEKLTERFPDCVHIDIEIDHNQLLSYSDDIEKVKNFQTMDLEKHPLVHEPWVDEAINRILGKDFEQKLKYQKSINIKRPDEKIDKSFLNFEMGVDEDYIYECTIVDEDERFEILQEHLEQESSNRQYEEFEEL